MTPATALERWKTAGRVEVTLPSGFKVAGVLPTVELLMLRGGIPGTLQDVAMQFATVGVKLTGHDPDAASKFMQFAREMAAAFVREVWDDQTETWEPVTLTAADFDGHFDQLDIDALEELALRQKSAEQINNRNGGPGPIAAWAEFRSVIAGVGPGADGGAVRAAPVDAPPDNRASRRARSGSSTRNPPGGRRRRGKSSSSG